MSLHPSIRVEGGLLGPDVLDQLLAGELPGQRAADFGLGGKRNLTDEIASAFADARALALDVEELGSALARDCGYDGPPFIWDDDRRFEIRCELDAAFFHLYLPAETDGQWRIADRENSNQLAGLQRHFPTPRDAVVYIMDQFPIVRQKDEEAHGRFRTKDRILEIYDAMLAAQRSGTPFQTKLDPPPGCGSSVNEA